MVSTQPVGITIEPEYHRTVQQPVEHRRGNGGVTEDLTPFNDWPIRGDHDRDIQISLHHNLNNADATSAGKGTYPSSSIYGDIGIGR